MRFADRRNIDHLTAHSLDQGRVFIFGVHNKEFCIGIPQIHHQDLQLNKQRLTAAGGAQHHAVAVCLFRAQPHDQVAGNRVDTVEDTPGVQNFLHIKGHKRRQPSREHGAHTGNLPQSVWHSRIECPFLLQTKLGKAAVKVRRCGSEGSSFSLEVLQ